MKIIILFLLCLSPLAADDALLEHMLNKNGDVYVMVSVTDPSLGFFTDGALYRFISEQDYRRQSVITSGPLASRISNYVGFSVDKFGHIKLFRSEDDADGAAASILDLTTRLYPGETGTVTLSSNSMAFQDYGTTYEDITAVSAGWRYVISPDGKQGWKKIYRSSGGADSMGQSISSDMNATSGIFKLELIPGSLNDGDIVLPPFYKSYPRAFYLGYHGGFWQGGARSSYAVEHKNALPFNSYETDWGCCDTTTFSPDPESDWGCYALPWNDPGKQDWVLYDRGPGNANSFPLSPPIGAIFMLPHCTGSYTDYQNMRAASAVTDVVKQVKILAVDSFLSAQDNGAIRDYAQDTTNTDPKIFDTLTQNQDWFTGGAHSSDPDSPLPVASTTTYASTIARWNHCGDLCGVGEVPQSISPPPPPMSTAYASSFGKNQGDQKLYLIKVASTGPGTIETYVVQVQTSGSLYTEKTIMEADGSAPSSRPYDSSASSPTQAVLVHNSISELDVNYLTDEYEQHVYKLFAGTADFPFSCPDGLCDGSTPRALGFSKRRQGKTDYIYVTDFPPSHFTVSSNFWGTGGTVWVAEETPSGLILHFRSYNHTSGNMTFGSIDHPEVRSKMPIQSIAADGDNNVYFVHSHNNFESEDVLKRNFANGLNRSLIQSLCSENRITAIRDPQGVTLNCLAPEPIIVPSTNGILMSPVEFTIEMPQHAGFVVEKVSPVEGSQPEVVGVVPSTPVGMCTFKAYFPLDSPGDANFDWTKDALFTDNWACTVDNGNFSAETSGAKVHLSVINVPNPPASGTDTQIDIVHPCSVSSQQSHCNNGKILEDHSVQFRMENPPHFAGVTASLGESSDPRLNVYGDVRMISNYLRPGYNFTATLPLSSGEAGTVQDLYWDTDERIGVMTSTLLNQDISLQPTNSLQLMNPEQNQGDPANKTMRYRWLVRSLTPPHSLIDYAIKPLPFKPAGYPNTVKTGCSPINAGIAAGLPPAFPEESPSSVGLLYDSCWNDMNRIIAVSSSGDVIAPENLDYKFLDPGEYEVTLMVGALGFELEDISYLSDPASVGATMIVTWYSMPVTVSSSLPNGANPFVTEVRISTEQMENNESHLKVGTPPVLSNADFSQAFLNNASNGLAWGPLGSAPLYPVHYYKDSRLTVSQQNQLTPIYAEAKIKFFRSLQTEYRDGYQSLSSEALQTKFSGVGAWDYEFNCPGAFDPSTFLYTAGCQSIDGIQLKDKASLHPSNWSSSSPSMLYTTRFGNDATADSSSLSSRAVHSSGYSAASADFDVLQQGTLSSDDYYPDGGILDSPHALYDWYEIKYAWFIRYQTPSGEIKNRILRTGNLSEIFWLNYYANHHSSSEMHNKFQLLIKQVAPDDIRGSGSPLFTGNLIVPTGNPREYSVRIPLLNHNAILSGDPLSELNGDLKWDEAGNLNPSDLSFFRLLSEIHPMKFPIPTGVTVLELGFQLFAPIVTWKGVPSPSSTAEDPVWSYFDAVPGYMSSGSVLPATYTHQLKEQWCFPDPDGDCIQTWEQFGTPLYDYSLNPASTAFSDFGIKLAAAPSGFIVGDGTVSTNSGDVSYHATQDQFVEILVSDLQNPELSTSGDTNLVISAGQTNTTSFYIHVKDNNPFGNWLSASPAFNTSYSAIPALEQISIELGYDPRNHFGLSLLPLEPGVSNSYGFRTSEKSVSHDLLNLGRNSAFNKDTLLASAYPHEATPKILPGGRLERDSSVFLYAGSGGDTDRSDDRFYTSIRPPLQTASITWGMNHFLNRPMESESFFTPVSPMEQPVYEDTSSSINLPMLYHVIEPHWPHENGFGFPEESFSQRHVHLYSVTEPDHCLETELPPFEEPENCQRETIWEVPEHSISAPYFFNHDLGINRAVFATGRDTRLYGPYLDDSGELGLDSYYFRLGGKTNADFSASAVQSSPSPLDSLRSLSTYPYAKEVATLSVEDKSPPSLRVSLTDFKTRQTVHYSAVPVHGSSNKTADGKLTWNKAVRLYRSEDPRNLTYPGRFNAPAITLEQVDENPSSQYRIAEEAGYTSPNELFYEIPEDTRFEILITMSDNQTDQLLGGTLQIQSGTCAEPGIDPGGLLGLQRTSYPVATTTRSPGNQYLDMAQVRTFHKYPRKNRWDELLITATDESGNSMGICIPVHVLSQEVLFQQIGSERKMR